jgi:hypothetical protein
MVLYCLLLNNLYCAALGYLTPINNINDLKNDNFYRDVELL